MNGPDNQMQHRNPHPQDETAMHDDAHMHDQTHTPDEALSAADLAFEAALTRALQRVDPPPALSEKLLAAADHADAQQQHASGSGFKLLPFGPARSSLVAPQRGWTSPQRAWNSWVGGAIAAVLALGVFVGSHTYQQHERRVRAQQQFDTAERITDQTLEHAREQLRDAGITLGQ